MGSERVEGWGVEGWAVEGGDPPELTWFSEWCRKWQQNLYSVSDSSINTWRWLQCAVCVPEGGLHATGCAVCVPEGGYWLCSVCT